MWNLNESISIHFEEFFISNFETFLWWLLCVFLNLTNHSGSILCILILIADLQLYFKIDQKTSMGLILFDLWEICSFGTNFNAFSSSFLDFIWITFFFGKTAEFWEFSFLTQFVLESIRMDLHVSYAPFWNETSVSNLLILSNL